MERCGWSSANDGLMLAYHDNEWGVPVHDDKKLFEFLVLEGAQAGLSWSTILKRREGYQRAFSDFDPQKVALYADDDVTRLLSDRAIIRNRLKITSAITNAREFIKVQEEFGTFDRYIWQFVDGSPIQNSWTSLKEIPASTEISLAISKDLKKRGFRFVGSTICYAHMQATGMVNDHIVSCFRYNEVRG
jgi:DNA-3-methyladenine glycosylase I